MPGVQKPHCNPWFSLNAACFGCKVPSACATPSMVRMSAPSACMATIEQLLVAFPFICTVQAPHWAVSQPTCVPVKRRFSRMSVTRSVRSSISADTGFPLTFMETLTDMLGLLLRIALRGKEIVAFPHLRLLIVEDDVPLATGLRRILEAEGHAVDVTARGEQAVLAAAQERFDLVILDIGLPQMDGFEVLRRLRAAGEWAVLEVLLGKVEKIVSKEAIIQAVAGWGDDLSPNAIEVYVSRLRSKLEPAGIKIRTVRGFGYMLEEYKGPSN